MNIISVPAGRRSTFRWRRVFVQGKIKSLEQIYLFSLPVKEYQIVDYFLVSGACETFRYSYS